jgi:hypothetical protein
MKRIVFSETFPLQTFRIPQFREDSLVLVLIVGPKLFIEAGTNLVAAMPLCYLACLSILPSRSLVFAKAMRGYRMNCSTNVAPRPLSS